MHAAFYTTFQFAFIFIRAGLVLVSAGSDNTVRVWDVKEGKCTHVLATPHTDSVRCVQLCVSFLLHSIYMYMLSNICLE